MEIREAVSSDLPAIIKVLKASLGESDLPLSEEIWKFKHVDNPFGVSMVFVAVENGHIAGVRAFMKWKWQKGKSMFSAFRAVDTATHPEYQGMGIFKRLTLKAVESGSVNDDDIVFNTPNDQSRPGYLKMGWEIVGKVRVGIQPCFTSFFNLRKGIQKYGQSAQFSCREIDELCDSWNRNLEMQGLVFTPKSQSFLNWRYKNNPLQKYHIVAEPDFYMAVYIKRRKRVIKELRIAECIYNPTPETEKKLNYLIKKLAKNYGAHLITFSPQVSFPDKLALVGDFGPILTVKELAVHRQDLNSFKQLRNWAYSLGDLELF